ncbi:RNA polymerase sigma factor [Brevundimonas sp.]|uniref:RNA polymerase sigma factor n=1 Tax=Brevundimonas sp. TaxID=1871086 RepID=UPI003D09CA43
MTASPASSLLTAYLEQREAMRRFFQARLGPAADVEDLLQDLYLKAATVDAATEVREPRAYLYRLASNLMMDRWRSGRRSAVRDTAWRDVTRTAGPTEDIDDAPSAEAVVAGRERLAALMEGLTHLPPRTQAVFRLHKFDGLSYAEVAENLKVSRSTVEKHMMDALRHLTAKVRQ